MAAKVGEQKTITLVIDKKLNVKKSYVVQMVAADYYLDLMDECRNEDGNLQTGKYIKKLCEATMVNPKYNPEDFTGNIRLLRRLNGEIEKFVMGEDVEVDEGNGQNDGNDESETNGSSGDPSQSE